MLLVAPFLLLFVFIFMMNRGEKKKRAKLEAQLKRGDRVITRSGIKGKLVELTDTGAKVEIAPGVQVSMLKTAIEGLDQGETAGAKASSKDKAAEPGGKTTKK